VAKAILVELESVLDAVIKIAPLPPPKETV
jgi:hypothetical protein